MWTTVGALLVSHHLFLQVYLPRRDHLGSRIQMEMLQGSRWHSENMRINVVQ